MTAQTIYKTCDVCRRDFPKGSEKHYTCPDCANKDYSHLVGKVMRTPFEPSGLVKVLAVEGPFDGKQTVFIEYVEDHPHGYRNGEIGRYYAHELRAV